MSSIVPGMACCSAWAEAAPSAPVYDRPIGSVGDGRGNGGTEIFGLGGFGNTPPMPPFAPPVPPPPPPVPPDPPPPEPPWLNCWHDMCNRLAISWSTAPHGPISASTPTGPSD